MSPNPASLYFLAGYCLPSAPVTTVSASGASFEAPGSPNHRVTVIWLTPVEVLYALKYDRDHNETEALMAIENAVPGQHPMIDLTQALIVNFRMCQQKQAAGES